MIWDKKNLWDELINIGFVEEIFPKNNIDYLSEKYKIIKFFHKTEYRKSRNLLRKYNMMVYFDDYNVDFFSYDNSISFNKSDSIDNIFNYIKQIDKKITRNLKFKRLE